MKNFRKSITFYLVEKITNPLAKLCWDKKNNQYVVTYFFVNQKTFDKINYEIIL